MWPVAASSAPDQTNKWIYEFAASFILGLGHLVSSIAVMAVFFYAKGNFDLAQVNEPITVDLFSTTLHVGGPVSLVAGVLLITLGIREYVYGHSHGTHSADRRDNHENDHSHEHYHDHDRTQGDGDRHRHDRSHEQGEETLLAQVKVGILFVGGHVHSHNGEQAHFDEEDEQLLLKAVDDLGAPDDDDTNLTVDELVDDLSIERERDIEAEVIVPDEQDDEFAITLNDIGTGESELEDGDLGDEG